MKYIFTILIVLFIKPDDKIPLGKYELFKKEARIEFHFQKNNHFTKTTYILNCGLGIPSNGIYSTKNDTLILDFSEEINNSKKELDSQYYKVLKQTESHLDSISLKINFIDLESKEEIADRYITIDEIQHFQLSFDEPFELKLPKKERMAITFGHFEGNEQYKFNIAGGKNIDLEVGISYVIEELLIDKEQFLIEKVKDDRIVLKHIQNKGNSKRLTFVKVLEE